MVKQAGRRERREMRLPSCVWPVTAGRIPTRLLQAQQGGKTTDTAPFVDTMHMYSTKQGRRDTLTTTASPKKNYFKYSSTSQILVSKKKIHLNLRLNCIDQLLTVSIYVHIYFAKLLSLAGWACAFSNKKNAIASYMVALHGKFEHSSFLPKRNVIYIK